MSLVTLPTTFASQSSGTPQQFDNNFSAIIAQVNGGLDSTNMDSSYASNIARAISAADTMDGGITASNLDATYAASIQGAIDNQPDYTVATETILATLNHDFTIGDFSVGDKIQIAVTSIDFIQTNDTGLTRTIKAATSNSAGFTIDGLATKVVKEAFDTRYSYTNTITGTIDITIAGSLVLNVSYANTTSCASTTMFYIILRKA